MFFIEVRLTLAPEYSNVRAYAGGQGLLDIPFL